jgi:hypothetical protein
MNGGAFSPHASHRDGIDVDGYFAGYEKRDATTAAQIIQHLNDPIFGVTLQDGRAATSVIRESESARRGECDGTRTEHISRVTGSATKKSRPKHESPDGKGILA